MQLHGDDVEKALLPLRHELAAAKVALRVEGGTLHLDGPSGTIRFKIVPLYRPSAQDVARQAAHDVVLVLYHASEKAMKAAKHHNHLSLLSLPRGSSRLVAPGVALIYEPATGVQTASTAPTARRVRLRGRTGVVAESLLLDSQQRWTVRNLSQVAQVSAGLAHRVLARLEGEGLVTRFGKGPDTYRIVNNPRALAELWSQEESAPVPLLRGFVSESRSEVVAQQVLECWPDGAVGGVLDANLYKPTLPRVFPPVRIWVGDGFDPEVLKRLRFQEMSEAVNLELVTAKDNPWRVHREGGDAEQPVKVSRWRAWLEVSGCTGVRERLADALLADLLNG